MLSSTTSPTVFGLRRAVGLSLVGFVVLVAALWIVTSLYLSSQAVSERSARAFRFVTSPDVRIERLRPTASGIGSGFLYERSGIPEIVVVVNDLPALGANEQFMVWFAKSGKVLTGQRIRLDADGVGRVILEPIEPGVYDQITIAREGKDAAIPSGPVILTWTRTK